MQHISCHCHTSAVPSHVSAPQRHLSHLAELWESWRHFSSAVSFSLKNQTQALLNIIVVSSFIAPLARLQWLRNSCSVREAHVSSGRFYTWTCKPTNSHWWNEKKKRYVYTAGSCTSSKLKHGSCSVSTLLVQRFQ